MSGRESKSRQTWASLGLVAIIGVAALIAPSLEEETLTIAVHQGVEGVALKATVRDFSTREHVSVEVFELPYDALYAAEMKELRLQRPKYDVMMVDDQWLPALIGEDDIGVSTRIERLDFSSGECDRLNINDFVASTLQVSLHPGDPKSRPPSPPGEKPGPFSCRDPFYALPFVGNSQLFLTRRNLRPATWKEVLDITLQPTRGMDAGYVARVGAGNSIVTDFMPILWSSSPGNVSPHQALASGESAADDALELDQQKTMDAFRFLRKLGANPRANRGVVSVDDFDLAIYLVQKHASMSIAWSAWVMAIAKLPPPYNSQLLEPTGQGQAELEITQVPGGQPALGAWLLSIPAKTERKDLARKFLLFATAKEQIVSAAQRGNPPPRESVLQDPSLNNDYPFFSEQLDSLSNARARPRTPHWRDIEQVLGACLSALYENAMTEDDAWERVNEGLEPIRKKQRAIEAIRAKQKVDETSDSARAKEAARSAIRAVLDEPWGDFSCVQRQRGLPSVDDDVAGAAVDGQNFRAAPHQNWGRQGRKNP